MTEKDAGDAISCGRDSSTGLGPPPVGALTGGEVAMLRAWAEDYARAERMAERAANAREHVEAENKRLRALLADADILAQHSGASDSREWHTAQCWLRPGEVLAHMDAPPEGLKY